MTGPSSVPQPPPPPPLEGVPAAAGGGVTPPARPNPYAMLAIGLIAGVVIGGAGGYLIFHGKTAGSKASPTPGPHASSQPSATASATASATPASEGVVACPPTVPSGQHALGKPGGPGKGSHVDPALDFCGRGSTTLPPGTTRFTTHNSWSVGSAHSCPQGSSGQSGMGDVITINELLPDGSQGPDTATLSGDWSETVATFMAHGGNYQLQLVAVSPDCVWHIAIYPS